MSSACMLRYFINNFDEDSAPSTTDSAWTDALRSRVAAGAKIIRHNFPFDGRNAYAETGVYVGSAGIALAFYLLSRNESLPDDQRGECWELSKNYATIAGRGVLEGVPHGRPEQVVTFHTGEAGVSAVCLMVTPAIPNASESTWISRLEKVGACWLGSTLQSCCVTILTYSMQPQLQPLCLGPNVTSSELLYGRAGYLLALLHAQRYVGDPAEVTLFNDRMLFEVVEDIIRDGEDGAIADSPLMYDWHGRRYLGAAHGLCGILYVLLHFPRLYHARSHPEARWRKLVVDSIEYVCSVAGPDGSLPSTAGRSRGELVQWCHGSPGAVFLMLKAHQVFGDQKYLESARLFAEDTWRRGLLTKPGRSLCHGIAGNGYALLAMYKHTQEEKYMKRANIFGMVAMEHEELWQSDDPYSLYTGLAGLSCFYGDLLQPERALFPGYELPQYSAREAPAGGSA
eukprot:jgi/Chlat1/2173/Chrsp17S02744